jgi:hypothetical protein
VVRVHPAVPEELLKIIQLWPSNVKGPNRIRIADPQRTQRGKICVGGSVCPFVF